MSHGPTLGRARAHATGVTCSLIQGATRVEHLPAIGDAVEATLDDGRTFRLYVESRNADAITLTMPMDDACWTLARPGGAIFDLDRLVEVGWRIGRAWYAAAIDEIREIRDAAAIGIGVDMGFGVGVEQVARTLRWQVVFAEEPQPSNRRRYVRGAGGELVQLSDVTPGHEQILGTGAVVNLSEGGLRCQLPRFDHDPDAEVFVRISLDGGTIKAAAWLSDVKPLTRGHGVEATLTFRQLSDAEAQLIRRHIYQRQLAARRALRDAE